MSKTRIMTVEKELLSDGGWGIINRLGRSWSFTRTYPSDDQLPDCHIDIGKAKAYEMLAECLQNDVLEVEL